MKQKQILYEKLIRYILENQERFYRVAYSYTRHQEDALDVVQSAVCKALETYESIRNKDALRTWFYKILIHECLSVVKKRKRLLLSDESPEREEAYYEKGYEQDDDLEQELCPALFMPGLKEQELNHVEFFRAVAGGFSDEGGKAPCCKMIRFTR